MRAHILRRVLTVVGLTVLTVASQAQLTELWREARGSTSNIKFTPDMSYAVGGGGVRSGVNFNHIRDLPLPDGDWYISHALLPDARTVAIATKNKRVHLVDMHTALPVGKIEGLINEAVDIVAASNVQGQPALFVLSWGDLEYWRHNGLTWDNIHTWHGFSNATAVALSPNRRWIAVGSSNDDVIHFFDAAVPVATPAATYSCRNPAQISFGPASNRAFAATDIGIDRFDGPPWTFNRRLLEGKKINAVACTPNSAIWYEPNGDTIKRSDFNGNAINSYPANTGGTRINVAPNGIPVFSHGFVYIDLNGKVQLGPGHTSSIENVHISPTGNKLLTSDRSDMINIHNVSDNRMTSRWFIPDAHTVLEMTAFSQDGQYIVAQLRPNGPKYLQIFDAAWNALLTSVVQAYTVYTVSDCAAAGPGYVVYRDQAVASNRFTVMRLSDRSVVYATSDSEWVQGARFSRDGTRLAVITDSGTTIYRTSDWAIEEFTSNIAGSRLVGYDYTNSRLFKMRTIANQYFLDAYARRLVNGVPVWSLVKTHTFPAEDSAVNTAWSHDRRLLVVTCNSDSGVNRLVFFYAPTLGVLANIADSRLKDDAVVSLSPDGRRFALSSRFTNMLYMFANPFPTFLSSMSVTPTSVSRGQSASLKVNLTKPAPAGGVLVNLQDYTTSVWTPASVAVPEGQYSATTTVYTVPNSKPGSYLITGEYQFAQVSTTLQITP